MRAAAVAARGAALARSAHTASAAAGAATPRVLGCGSNVVDLFFPVRALPSPGDKAYFDAERLLKQQKSQRKH